MTDGVSDTERSTRLRARRRFAAIALGATALLGIGGAALGLSLNPFAPGPPPVTPATPSEGPGSPQSVSGGAMRAGQCFASYESAWQGSFELIDCATPHAAELYVIAPTPASADATYPGEEALRVEAMRACQAAESINLEAALGVPDLRIEASYALTQAEWDAGVRGYSCFASRTSGEPLDVSLAPAA